MDSKDYEDTDPWLPQQTVTNSNGNDCIYTKDSKHCNGFHKNTIKAIPRNSNGCNGHVVSNGDAPHTTDIEGVTRPNHCFSSRKHLSITKDLPKHIRRYYKDQNALIETFEEMRENLESNSNSESKSERRTTKMASLMSKITFAMNLLLLVAKAVAAGLSASLVMISSMLDSCMDLVSGALMWWSNRAIKNTNFTLYPRGRRKLEPVAIVVLAVIMSFVSVQVIHESVQKIIIYATQNFDEELMEIHAWMSSFNTTSPHAATLDVNSSDSYQPPLVPEMFTRIHRMHELLENCAKGHRAPVFELPTILICVATIVAKLVLFLICRRIDNPSVQALAKDHFNDVISNSGAIACGIIGYRLWVYADPLGAIIISLSIIINWSITAYEQIKMLTGYTAHPDFIKKVTWLALYHDERIQYIESVIAFHFGIRYLVEVTIVLPGEMSMRESHDLCESLQRKIERLPEVERTFIHIDYECDWIINSAKYSVRDDATETIDDATRTNDDATRTNDDAAHTNDDAIRTNDDATRKYDDATRTNDDAIVEEVV